MLCRHPVEAHEPPCEPGHAGLPEPESVASTAVLRHHHVEAEKPERRAVAHNRNRADGPPVEHTHEEALRVRCMERRGVVEARVPALVARPADREVEFGSLSVAQVRNRTVSDITPIPPPFPKSDSDFGRPS